MFPPQVLVKKVTGNRDSLNSKQLLLGRGEVNLARLWTCAIRCTYMVFKRSARQGWVVDWAPTDLQNGPTNGGVIRLPLPIKLPCTPVASLGFKPKGRVCVKSGCSGALKPVKLGLSCKDNKCCDAGTGDLNVLPTHDTSPWLSVPGECRLKYE